MAPTITENIELYEWYIQWHKSHFVTVNVKILPTTLSPYASAINNRIHQQANNTLNFISFSVFVSFLFSFPLSFFAFSQNVSSALAIVYNPNVWMDFEIVSDSMANH